MKTAEEIIQEYRDRGYSLESLRILAESREQPLGGQMLAVIDGLEASASQEASEMAEVPCETGTYGQVGDEMVFFVADDEIAADAENVDFDLMASTKDEADNRPAAREESVADIVIGETAGADMVSYKTEAVEPVENSEPAAPEASEAGIWGRLWSKVAQASTPALAPSMADEMAAAMDVAPAFDEEVEEEPRRPFFSNLVFEEDSGIVEPLEQEIVSMEPQAAAPESVSEVLFEHVVEEPVAAAVESVAEERVDVAEKSGVAAEAKTNETLLDDVLSDETVSLDDILSTEPDGIHAMDKTNATESGDAGDMAPAAAELDNHAGELPSLTDAEMFADVGAGSEISADYIPGSVAVPFEPEDFAAAMDEPESVAEVIEELIEEPVAESIEAPVEPEPVAEEPVEEPVAEAIEELIEEPVAESIETPAEPEPVAEEPIEEPVAEVIEEPVAEVIEEPVAEVIEELVEEPVAESIEAPAEPEPVLEEQPAPEPASTKISRKEKRRRERLEKKKAKRAQKKVEAKLPEIVLARSEETETLVPEPAAETAEPVASAIPAEQEVDTSTAETAEYALAPIDGEAAAEAEVPPMGEPMSILTPADIVSTMEDGGDETPAEEKAERNEPLVSPETLAALSAHSLALAASLVAMTQGELAKAAEIIEQNRLAALAVEQNNAEAELENIEEEMLAAEETDYPMIIANGGLVVEDAVETHDDADEESDVVAEGGNNVILFSNKFPLFAGEIAGEEDDADETMLGIVEEDEEEYFEPVLRMLPSPENEIEEDERELALVPAADVAEEANETLLPAMLEEKQPLLLAEPEPAAEAVEEPASPAVDAPLFLSDEDKQTLLFALAGAGEEYDVNEEVETAGGQHVIVSEEPETESIESLLERESALRLELEEEYQSRLDGFAAQLLDVQTAAAASEAKVAEKKAELEARTAILEEMRNRLAAEEEKQRDLLRRLDEAAAAIEAKSGEIERFNGLQEEHGRLFGEFEDLRKAYNEIVTEVMPGLQSERDDLAMTIERQCAKEKKLRTSLRSSRKRLAAGYVLGAAACFMLVALPVANWLRSGDDSRKLAVDHQRLSELQDTLQTQMRENVDAQTRIVELERKITRARDEITRLDSKNKELASLATGQHAQGIAVFKPQDASTAGTPTRASTMALQATVPQNGPLHVNEVMDPAGSIEQLAMENRHRNAGPARANAPQMAKAQTGSGTSLPVSALVSTNANTNTNSNSLRPGQKPVAAPAGGVRPTAVAQATASSRPAAQQARPGVVTAKVKKGEGVAQVVYRVLNTRDPDVIAWVIEENKIRSDRRGNPIIQPNQELRLPKDGSIGQAASAAGKPRR